MDKEILLSRLRIPAIQAPMFLLSGPDMVIAACEAGVVGSFPTPNARTLDELEQWMARIQQATQHDSNAAPWALNMIVHPTYPRLAAELELVKKYQPAIVITALGSPRHVVEQVHSYGGLVLADVINPRFARKAVAAGVDGLVLVSVGAGGHTGYLSPFVFVDEVRQFWDGIVVLGGGITSGKAIHAANVMGADLAYLGTRFIATEQSMAQHGYKQMVVDASADDIVCSDAITGVNANWLRQSLINSGYDPDNMPEKNAMDLAASGADNKRWKDIWAAGQGVGNINTVVSVASVVDVLTAQYHESLNS